MRTLHIIDRLDRRMGGSVQATLEICRYLALDGQQVEVAGTIGSGDILDHLDGEFQNLTIHRFERSFPKRYANSHEFNRWLSRSIKEYDIVEIHAIFSAMTLYAGRICRSVDKPYFIRPHGSLDPFDLRKHAALKRIVGPLLIRQLLSGAAAIILTAPLEAERLVSYGANVRKIVLPLPVTLVEETGDRYAFRRRHSIPADALVVLFMSRIDYKKGLEFLIPALGILKKKCGGLWFVLAGAGEAKYTNLVQKMIKGHELSPCTTQLGFVTGRAKQDALAAADIFALPSLNENFGIVNIEAMNAGLPLMISNEVYISGDVARAGAGVICETNGRSVLMTLESMVNGTIDLKLMGKRGREFVSRQYRPETATRSLVRMYYEILKPGGEGVDS